MGAKHSFTYTLFSAGRIVGTGEGRVPARTAAAVAAYLAQLYGAVEWDTWEAEFHFIAAS